MRCQPPERVPVLSTLALEFAVCTRWFCSVPGETWPNRNFVHSATSDGTTIIVTRFYENQTIFELLEKAGKTWRIYYDDTPQVWAFKHLWDTPDQASNWFRFADFATTSRPATCPITPSSSQTTARQCTWRSPTRATASIPATTWSPTTSTTPTPRIPTATSSGAKR